MRGYIALGGIQSSIELFSCKVHGSIGSRHRGRWGLDTDYEHVSFDLPARDKSVQLYARDNFAFVEELKQVDSLQEENYKAKLRVALTEYPWFDGFVVNRNVDSHDSFAIISQSSTLHLWGLYDTQMQHAYLVWSDSAYTANDLRNDNPLRFLMYRFPETSGIVFIQIETICAKWWRWTKNKDILYAFNALEQKLI